MKHPLGSLVILAASMFAVNLVYAGTVTVPYNSTWEYKKKTVDAGKSSTWQAGVAQIECAKKIEARAKEFGGKVKSAQGVPKNLSVVKMLDS